MKAINFYNACIHDKHLSIFHTGSLAEFHEPPLRTLLAKYVSAIKNDESYSYDIMNDDKEFNLAVHKYKNIVTHYLASKMEIWFGTFFGPIYDIHDGSLMHEFARSRGAIHYHSLFSATGKFWDELQNCLFLLTVTIHESMEDLKSFIAWKWREPEDRVTFKIRPDELICSETGEECMERFCHLRQGCGGERVWNKYVKAKKEAISKAELEIGRLFETKYGVNALHEGIFPKDWAKPGGYPNNKYPHTYPEMQSSQNVLDKKELKHSKFQRELDLPNRGTNIKNHAFLHKHKE